MPRRVVVCVKHSVDIAELKFDPKTGEPLLGAAKRKLGDIDKRAVEEAVRLKEAHGFEVVAVTVGPPEAKSALREALAMGADSAVLVWDEALRDADAHATSVALAAAVKSLAPFDLVLCGEASSDTSSYQIGPRLGEVLGLPAITYASRVSVEGGFVLVERELEDSVEYARAKLPAVIAVTREINEPRQPKLMDILRASKKEIREVELSDVGLSPSDVEPALRIASVRELKVERKRVIFKDVPASEAASLLVEALEKEGVLG